MSQVYGNMFGQQVVNEMYHATGYHSLPKSATSSISMELEDKELWTRVYNMTNEMILTKAGR